MLRSLLSFACLIALPGSAFAQDYFFESSTEPAKPAPIRRVIFEKAPRLSQQARQEIAKALCSETVSAASISDDMRRLADEATERARAAYQDEGYFKAEVNAKAVVVEKSPSPQYDIKIEVLAEGKQYRLRDLRVIHMTVFPEQQLRDLFPLRQNEIFSREKVATGLESLRRLYGSRGYVNFTNVPLTEVDEGDASIDLVIDIDEGRLFRWGDLHVESLPAEDQRMLTLAWAGLQGKPYVHDDGTLERFLREFFRPLREGTSAADHTTVKPNESAGTVDVYLNLVYLTPSHDFPGPVQK